MTFCPDIDFFLLQYETKYGSVLQHITVYYGINELKKTKRTSEGKWFINQICNELRTGGSQRVFFKHGNKKIV